ncbi:hypothetical protein ACFOW6_16590 [Fodinicurvata halophila]|uniref:Uncharacterized protein n=1 Tax=Fodinicurvata halophila TaxID=1419723 RepID=A0ABV8UQ75_9PROT
MNTEHEVIALGSLFEEAIQIANQRIDAIPEDTSPEEELRAIQDASTVPEVIAYRISELPAESEQGQAVKHKALSWLG